MSWSKSRKRKWSGGGSGGRRSSAVRYGHGAGCHLGETGLSDDEIGSYSDGSDSSSSGGFSDDEDDLSEGGDDVDVAVAAFLSGVALEDDSDFSDGDGDDAREGVGVDGTGVDEGARWDGDGGGSRVDGGGGGRGESKVQEQGQEHKGTMRYFSSLGLFVVWACKLLCSEMSAIVGGWDSG